MKKKISELMGMEVTDLSKLDNIEKKKMIVDTIETMGLRKIMKEEIARETPIYLKKLNLGCGNRKLEGFLNIDKRANVNPDIVLDLENGLPDIPDDSVEMVFASNILEHVNNLIPLMDEIYRVCKHGAEVVIFVPHWQSHHAFSDPTHVRFFTEHTFEYFDRKHRDLNIKSFDYNFKCNFDFKEVNLDKSGIMKVTLIVNKEDKNA